MITKHNIVVITLSVLIAGSIPFIYRSNTHKKIIGYQIFHVRSGWGYDIIMEGKLVIHQEYIPVISQKKEFPTETKARQTAELVVSKLKNNKFPTLSETEVEQICGNDNQEYPMGRHE